MLGSAILLLRVMNKLYFGVASAHDFGRGCKASTRHQYHARCEKHYPLSVANAYDAGSTLGLIQLNR